MLARSSVALVAKQDPVLDLVIIRSKRRTMALSVNPHGGIEVRAPDKCSDDDIRALLHKRRLWILRQQRSFASIICLPAKQYVSGESFRYLGRQYRLKIKAAERPEVKLIGGYLCIQTKVMKPERIKRMMEEWTRERALTVFQKKATAIAIRINLPSFSPTAIQIRIRYMKYRWGSCTVQGLISLNPDLIKAPGPCIDYVILHELCHLQEPNHGARFYRLLDRFLPNWRTLKARLESGNYMQN